MNNIGGMNTDPRKHHRIMIYHEAISAWTTAKRRRFYSCPMATPMSCTAASSEHPLATESEGQSHSDSRGTARKLLSVLC